MEDTMEIKKVFFDLVFFEKMPKKPLPFVVKDKFQVYLNWCAEVKIAYINDKFKEWFLEIIEEPEVEQAVLACGKLRAKTRESFLSEDDENKSALVSDIFFKLKKQANGEKGDLITKWFTFKTNIFFCEDISGKQRFIFVAWDRKQKGWSIVAKEIDFFGYEKKLAKGSRVFFRK